MFESQSKTLLEFHKEQAHILLLELLDSAAHDALERG